MIDTKRRVTKLVVPVILVVVRSSGDWAKDRRYWPGGVSLRVASIFTLSMRTTGLFLRRGVISDNYVHFFSTYRR